ncbi:hypothetical protein V1227_05125 [Lentzea sp. DG1S-22]|uniref:hypothetical protein n=1 Tax=Lentzea sp. DG1S-22 TaxID=3108822 RepID=UPI002E76B990|nr:hypothetical protein [Lentzea sp. DG1S-22]WVH82140.1 hypothetical protein V1227_05125 [Lentzea sp. DG1S-22]
MIGLVDMPQEAAQQPLLGTKSVPYNGMVICETFGTGRALGPAGCHDVDRDADRAFHRTAQRLRSGYRRVNRAERRRRAIGFNEHGRSNQDGASEFRWFEHEE